METRIKSITDRVFGYYSEVAQTIRIGIAHLCFLFVFQEMQILAFYFSIYTGSQSVCYYFVYLTLLPIIKSTLLCTYIGIGIFLAVVAINVATLFIYAKLKIKSRQFLNSIGYIYIYFNRVAYVPLQVLILAPFLNSSNENIDFMLIHYSISIVFSVLLLVYSSVLCFLMMERRVGLKFSNAAISCTYEYFQNIESFFSIIALIISKSISQPFIVVVVLFGLSFVCLVKDGFKRSYSSDIAESVTLTLKLNKAILGAFILAMTILQIEFSFTYDLFEGLSLFTSIYMCTFLIKYNDKRTIQILCNIWNKRRYDADNVIDAMLLMSRLIENRDECRAHSIRFKGFMMMHVSQCTDPMCPLTMARNSMADPSSFYSDFDTFIMKYFKSSHKIISYFFNNNASR